jgi:hypothetical protein
MGPSCRIFTLNVPEEPKLTDKVACLAAPVFCVTAYGTVQVISVSSGSGFGEQVIAELMVVIQLTLSVSSGLPQSTNIVKVNVAFHVPPLAGRFVNAVSVPGAQLASGGPAPLFPTVTAFSLPGEPL